MCSESSKIRPSSSVTSAPSPTPIAPPMHRQHHGFDQDLHHDVGCRAPSDLRMPISRVRSVTLTSMMFMMTMPPTTSEMQVTGTTTAATMPSNWSMKPRIASGVIVSKLSAWPGRSWKRSRSATRVWSSASFHGQAAARPRPREHREARAGAVHAVEGGVRNVDRFVLVAPERRAQLFLHSHHREFDAVDAHDLAQRRGAGREQRVLTVSPITATKARERSSCSVKKRPSTTPISRMLAMSAETPIMVVSSQVRLSRFTSETWLR